MTGLFSLRRALYVLMLMTFVGAKFAVAQESGDPDLDALVQTQKLLTDKTSRKSLIESDQKVSDIDKKIYTLTKGSEVMSQEVYSISSEVFGQLFQQSGGDAEKMQAILEKAKADPKGFYDSLSPELKLRVRSVAGEIEVKNGGQAPK